jgi:hypothetical protein
VRAWVAAWSLASLALLASGCQGAGGGTAAARPRPTVTAPAAAATPDPSATAPPAAPTASAVPGLPSPPPPGPAATAHLTIAGSSRSQVDSTTSRGPCGAGSAGYAAELTFRLNGQAYVLSMDIASYHGPGRYSVPPERVSLHTETGAPNPTLAAAVSGSVTINPDQRSGSIDTALSDHSRVTGAWTCG